MHVRRKVGLQVWGGGGQVAVRKRGGAGVLANTGRATPDGGVARGNTGKGAAQGDEGTTSRAPPRGRGGVTAAV